MRVPKVGSSIYMNRLPWDVQQATTCAQGFPLRGLTIYATSMIPSSFLASLRSLNESQYWLVPGQHAFLHHELRRTCSVHSRRKGVDMWNRIVAIHVSTCTYAF
jgi:hypothetical protein